MLRNSFTKWLWDARRSVLGWALAIAVVGGGYAAFWPTVDTPELSAALASYPEALLEAINYSDIASPAGYVNSTVGLVVAALMVVYGVAGGTRTVAGDEEAGTLDLVLAHPLSRARLALERFASFLVSVGIISLALFLAMLALKGPARLEGISVGQFAALHLHLVLFGALFGSLAFAVGAATGRKAPALAVGAGAAVLGFIANGIISQVQGLEWVKGFSPFNWLNGNNPLRNGVDGADALLMLGLTVVLVGAGTWAFGRRDVAV